MVYGGATNYKISFLCLINDFNTIVFVMIALVPLCCDGAIVKRQPLCVTTVCVSAKLVREKHVCVC